MLVLIKVNLIRSTNSIRNLISINKNLNEKIKNSFQNLLNLYEIQLNKIRILLKHVLR